MNPRPAHPRSHPCRRDAHTGVRGGALRLRAGGVARLAAAVAAPTVVMGGACRSALASSPA